MCRCTGKSVYRPNSAKIIDLSVVYEKDIIFYMNYVEGKINLDNNFNSEWIKCRKQKSVLLNISI